MDFTNGERFQRRVVFSSPKLRPTRIKSTALSGAQLDWQEGARLRVTMPAERSFSPFFEAFDHQSSADGGLGKLAIEIERAPDVAQCRLEIALDGLRESPLWIDLSEDSCGVSPTHTTEISQIAVVLEGKAAEATTTPVDPDLAEKLLSTRLCCIGLLRKGHGASSFDLFRHRA